MKYTPDIPMNHSLHDQYAKPEDECLTCQSEKLAQIEDEADRVNMAIDDAIEAQIDQMREDTYHNHMDYRR